MIRSGMKKRAQLVLHGKYGNWSLIVLVPLIVGILFFICSLFFQGSSVGDYEENDYQSWQDSNRGAAGATDNQSDKAYEEGFEDGYSQGYDEGWSDGWDESLMEENSTDSELDNRGQQLNTLSNDLQVLNSSKDINRTIANRYRDSVSHEKYNLGGLIFMFFSLIIPFLAVLYGGMLSWAAVDSISGIPFTLKTVFNDFIGRNGKRVTLANFWVTIYTILWTLLFVVPGLVKGAAYSMTNYLLKKDTQLTAKEAIILSQKLMNGYKMEYLILRVSFIFWYYANIFSFGITSFYVIPYYSVTEALFFDQVIQDQHHLFTDEREAGFEDF